MRVLAETSERESQGLAVTRGILLYEGREGGKEMVLAVHHEVVATEGMGGRPILGPGSPLDRRTIDLIMRQIAGQPEARKREMIPAELLYADEGRMVWYARSKRHPIFFRTGRREFDKAMNAQEVLWPNLLFCAERGSLKAWALATGERPTPDTPLYFAPFYNWYDNGAMCAGNVPLPDLLTVEGRGKWEQAVYETEFTHSNYHGRQYVAHPKGHDGLWKQMRWRALFQGFPVRALVPAPKHKGTNSSVLTVGEVIGA